MKARLSHESNGKTGEMREITKQVFMQFYVPRPKYSSKPHLRSYL